METGGFEVRGETREELSAKAQAVANHLLQDGRYQWQLQVAGESGDLIGRVSFAQLRTGEASAPGWFDGDPSVRWPTPADESSAVMLVEGGGPRSVPPSEGKRMFQSVDLGDGMSRTQERLAYAVCTLIGHRVEPTEGSNQQCDRCRRRRTRWSDGWGWWEARRPSRRAQMRWWRKAEQEQQAWQQKFRK